MYNVYAIQNNTGKIYIGYTAKLEDRLKRHNGLLKNKKKSFTYKNRGEWKLIFTEEYLIRSEAIAREKQLKTYQGRQFIKKQAPIAKPGRATAF